MGLQSLLVSVHNGVQALEIGYVLLWSIVGFVMNMLKYNVKANLSSSFV